jgi:N-acetylglucosamine kinase-like BadF-type ATPase
MTAQVFLGVEGGATRTTGALMDGDGRILARAEVGPSNIHAVGSAQAQGAIIALVTDLLLDGGARRNDLSSAALCMAGLRTERDRRAWQRVVQRSGLLAESRRSDRSGDDSRFRAKARHLPLLLTHDAAAALAAGSPDGTGLLLICGTGSLAYGRRADGRERSAIGLGPLLGDEGSGFDIGQHALRAVVRAGDERGPRTALTPRILAHTEAHRVDDLLHWASPADKTLVAEVAPLVFEAAEKGDSVAQDILDAALDELVLGATAAVRQLWPDEAQGPERVVLSGGVLCHQTSFREALVQRLRSVVDNAPCALARETGAVGAARLARRETRGL